MPQLGLVQQFDSLKDILNASLKKKLREWMKFDSCFQIGYGQSWRRTLRLEMKPKKNAGLIVCLRKLKSTSENFVRTSGAAETLSCAGEATHQKHPATADGACMSKSQKTARVTACSGARRKGEKSCLWTASVTKNEQENELVQF